MSQKDYERFHEEMAELESILILDDLRSGRLRFNEEYGELARVEDARPRGSLPSLRMIRL
jgi:hypothetical protein